VVSWSCWRNRFHEDPAILGKQIIVQDTPATIVGVAPRSFVGLRIEADTDVWLPRNKSSPMGLTILGRLKPGATIQQARAEMEVLYQFTIEERAARSKDPLVRQLKIELDAAGNGLSIVRDRFGKPLVVLMTVAGLLLLITCVNIASMLLARGAGREHEMAIRLGLGASRNRLLRQVLTESAVLSFAGTAAGIIVAYFGTSALFRILASGRVHERINLHIQPDLHTLFFTVAVALLAGLFFGLASSIECLPSNAGIRVATSRRHRRDTIQARARKRARCSASSYIGTAVKLGRTLYCSPMESQA
jgi:hypothetical protein